MVSTSNKRSRATRTRVLLGTAKALYLNALPKSAPVGLVVKVQNFKLIDQLNVFENVELPLIYLRMSAKERKEKVHEALEIMQIAHRLKHYPNQTYLSFPTDPSLFL